MGVAARRLALDGVHNFRDLGGCATTDGHRVRTGRMYRSDALHRMTDLDVERVRALGIASVVDLRAPDEVAHVGTGLIGDLGARYENLPTRPAIFASSTPPAPNAPERYLGYLTEGPDCFAGVVAALADPGRTPLVFFCNAGKDRTGVVAAMVLSVLGVPDDTIAHDYAATQDALDAIRAASRRDYPARVEAWRQMSPDMHTARPETMLAFLQLIRERLGGWDAYLDTVGAGNAQRAAMRASLLESDAP